MKIIDAKGKLFSKISIIDILILIVIVGLGVGFGMKTLSKETVQIVNANQTFYTTFMVEKLRDFSLDAVQEGDIFYEQYGGVIGKVVEMTSESAYDIVKKDDGTALYAPMEGRYNLYITLECKGNVNSSGYFINGNNQMSIGREVKLKSNMLMTSGKVFKLEENLLTVALTV